MIVSTKLNEAMKAYKAIADKLNECQQEIARLGNEQDELREQLKNLLEEIDTTLLQEVGKWNSVAVVSGEEVFVVKREYILSERLVGIHVMPLLGEIRN